jgi:hypothetical protein
MINWKIVAIFPVFAIIISILSGAIGGASFLDIVVRAVLWAIVFGGIGIGVNFLIERFFPELKGFMDEDSEKIVAKNSQEGGFEAFIPEDNPHELDEVKSSYSGVESEGLSKSRVSARTSDENDEGDIGELSDADGSESELGGGFMSTDETVGSTEESTGLDSDFSPGFGLDSEAGDISNNYHESGASMGNSGEKEAADEESSLVFDDDSIDKLPDSSSIEDSISGPIDDSSSNSTGSFSKPYKNTSVGEFEQDPHKTAKAIHTMMQRDKEG